jgi:hypothetical protein
VIHSVPPTEALPLLSTEFSDANEKSYDSVQEKKNVTFTNCKKLLVFLFS